MFIRAIFLEILQLYEWLILRLLEKTKEQVERNVKEGQDPFTAKNNSQVFYARNLSLAYIEVFRFIIPQITFIHSFIHFQCYNHIFSIM